MLHILQNCVAYMFVKQLCTDSICPHLIMIWLIMWAMLTFNKIWNFSTNSYRFSLPRITQTMLSYCPLLVEILSNSGTKKKSVRECNSKNNKTETLLRLKNAIYQKNQQKSNVSLLSTFCHFILKPIFLSNPIYLSNPRP